MKPIDPKIGTPAWRTHEVFNQSPVRTDFNEYVLNRPLAEAVEAYGGCERTSYLSDIGQTVGSTEFRHWAEQANKHPPTLRVTDRYGNRVDEVAYHPAYHAIMEAAITNGIHSGPWADRRPAAQVAQTAAFMMFCQVETGHGCSTSMTYAAVPALRKVAPLAERWEPALTSTTYDPRAVPAAAKSGLLAGMAMTEKQGGSDVRANTTRAIPLEAIGPGSRFSLTGHKWFCSAPMSDLFLLLAQTEHGVTCFLAPRLIDDGRPNGMLLMGLKDKLGNRSNASAELELHGTEAWLVGEPGRGVSTIIEMVQRTRLACLAMSAAGMRECVTEAVWHGAHRSAFGQPLSSQPLMRNVLADLCIESEAATLVTLRIAHAYEPEASEHERLFRRIATPVAKYWICKRGPAHAAEALECLGGNGYIEDFPLARRYREQPLMSVWEGAGNVMCLDVLRAISRSPDSLEALFIELNLARGANRRLDRYVAELRRDLADALLAPARARELTERLATALQASLLARQSPSEVADAFCETRLAPTCRGAYGTLPAGADTAAILARHSPETH